MGSQLYLTYRCQTIQRVLCKYLHDIVKLLALALTNLVLSLVNLAKPSLGQPSY